MKLIVYILIVYMILTNIYCEKKRQKPVIFEHPIDSHGLSLQRVLLRCVAEGVPQPKIEWYKEGNVVESYKEKPVTSNRHVKGNELLFLHLDTQDEGLYQCNASNSEGWAMSNNASVRIAYLDKIIGGPDARVASVGETVSLECRPPRGVPEPRVLWQFNGKTLETSKRIKIMPNGDLRIDKATRSDSGRYSCIAKNFAYQRQSESALLTVRQKPQFKVAPSNIEVRVNEAAVLACSVDGDPRPSIVWLRDIGKHIASSRATLLEDRGLRISRVQLSDAGNYICQARNSAGTIEAVAKLSVTSAPGFLETPESQEARVGDTVKFACQISGSPRPTVIWVHNGRHFMAPGDDEVDTSGRGTGERVRAAKDGSLVIGPVQVADAGKYECRASSYSGSVQSSAVLTVVDAGHETPPVIDVGPQNQTLPSGLTATFQCQALRSDDVAITWLKDGHKVNSLGDPRVIQLTSGTLKINLLRASDAGNYTCRAERGRAYSTWSVVLRVLDKAGDGEAAIRQTTDDARLLPGTPSNVEVVERGDTSVTVRWDPAAAEPGEAASVSHYVVEYSPYEARRGWYHSVVVQSSPAVIGPLRPGTGYRVLVRAVNDQAIGRPTVVPFVVFTAARRQAPPALSLAELKTRLDNVFLDQVRLRTVSSDQVTVAWQVAGPGPALRLLAGFLVLYRRVPLGRCLANSRDSFMEHCSLVENLLAQADGDLNNPRSALNEDGPELSKVVPATGDWAEDRGAAYAIINGLHPFICYELSVRPYLDHPKFGRLTGGLSKTRTVLTYDSVPSKAPQGLSARWITNTSIEIAWQPVPIQHMNGILKGYSLHMIGNDTNSTRSIEVSPKSTIVRVQDLIPHMLYVVHVAATTCQGEGIRSAGLLLTASSNIITLSPNVYGGRSAIDGEKSMQLSVAKQPWFISIMVVGGCLWLMICAFIVIVCRGIYLRGLIYKSGYSNGTKLVSNSNGQIQSITPSNGRLVTSHQSIQHGNIYDESNSSAMYKDTLILQPLMTSANSGAGTESKVEVGDAVANSLSAATNNNSISTNNNQRRFQDSISSNSTNSKCSTNQQRTSNASNISSNNVAPYASASLLQQVIGISTKNNNMNYNYTVNNPTTHRNILMPFSDNNLTSINQEMPTSQSYPLNAIDWAFNLPNKSDKLGPGILLNLGHVIPPPPQFPPPPAPISPTASNSTYYLQQDPTADDGTCSYASCPIDVPGISGASTALSSAPRYLWSAKDNGLVPVSGYIDYSCVPYNMVSMTRSSDNGSMASSFALPPPHDMLSAVHFSDDPYSPASNGGCVAQMCISGQQTDGLSSMMSSHMSNGSSAVIPQCGGSSSSAIVSGGSSREYSNKYEGASRSVHIDDSNSALEEEDDEDDDDKSSEDCCQESTQCQQSAKSESPAGWQSPCQRPSMFFPQIEEATYDTCPNDDHSSFPRHQQYYPQHNNYYPITQTSNSYYQPSSNNHHHHPRIDLYDNPPPPPHPLSSGQLSNAFLGCNYLGETPIV